jgi:hypothetical protein
MFVGELSMGRAVHGVKCPWDELSMVQFVHGASCPWSEMTVGRVSMERVVHGASFNVVELSGNHKVWNSENFSNSKVFPDFNMSFKVQKKIIFISLNQ